MEHINGAKEKVKELEVMAGLKLVQTEYRVQVPVFEPVVVKQPKFVEEVIKIPTGYDTVINALALELSDKVMNKMISMVTEKLEKVIDERIKEVKSPKIVEELVVKYKEVEVEKPVYKNVDVDLPKFVDREVINPVLVNKDVTNAVIIDKPVVNAIVEDVKVTNAIIKDVEVERAIIREKIVDVIHPRYLDLKGNEEK